MTHKNPTNTQALNDVLKYALTGINQYFLHARMLKHHGFMKLADYEYRQSLGIMKFADQLVDRVLHSGGVPNLQDLAQLQIGQDVPAMLAGDKRLEEPSRAAMQMALEQAEAGNDLATLAVLRAMIVGADEHIRYIDAQLNLIDSLGLPAYLENHAGAEGSILRHPAA